MQVGAADAGDAHRIGAMEPDQERSAVAGGRGLRIAGKVAYWVAVLVVSLALVFGLILLLESRDDSSVDGDARAPVGAPALV
jgi:hypothetical protein